MQDSVVGTDGNQYGPVDLITLKQWVTEGRVLPQTQVIDNLSNRTMPASQMQELGMSTSNPYAAPPAPAQYPRPEVGFQRPVLQGETHLGRVIFRSILAIILCLVLPVGGLISGAYCLYYGINAFYHKDKNAVACLLISLGAVAFVAIYTLVKMSHGVSPMVGN
jgi:hypothetical protein